MCTPKPSRTVTALVVAALLAAAPALAAPSADAPPAPGELQLVADWWAGLTSPITGLFAPAASTDDPTVQPQHGAGVDPDG